MAKHGSVEGRDGSAGLVEVLDYVRRHGTSTRSALVEATGLSRVSVAQRLAALLDRELLAEGELGPLDRRPRAAHPALPRRGRATCSSPTSARRASTSPLADLSGTILDHAAEPADVARRPGRRSSRASRSSSTTAGQHVDPLPGELWGIGIGVPGPVEFESGRPISPPIMPGWDGYPVRERFAHHGVPVWVDNDANVMALGELAAGTRPRRRQLRLREDRHRHRRRHDRAREAAPRHAGLRRRHRPHPGARSPDATSSAAAATSTASRRSRAAPRCGATPRPPRTRAAARSSAPRSTRTARSMRATSHARPRTAT